MRLRLLALTCLALLAALPLPAGAAERGRRAFVFVMGGKSEGSDTIAGNVEGWLLSEMALRKDYSVLDATTVAGGGAGAAVKSSFSKAAALLKEGQTLHRDGKWAEAAGKLGAARAEYEKLAPFVEPGEWTECLAWHGAAQLLAGEQEKAEKTFTELAVFDGRYEIGKLKLSKEVAKLFVTVRDEAVSGGRGTIQITSRPSGARVFVDGVMRGYAPLHVDKLLEGRHLVQIDRTGFEVFGQFVEVGAGGEQTVKAQLKMTKEMTGLEKELREAMGELKAGPGKATQAIGARLKIARAVFAVADGTLTRGKIELVLVDFNVGKVISRRVEEFGDNEFEEPEKVVRGLLKNVLIEGENAFQSSDEAVDPLKKRSGTEDWFNKGSAAPAETDDDDATSGEDPLEKRDGMEDW